MSELVEGSTTFTLGSSATWHPSFSEFHKQQKVQKFSLTNRLLSIEYDRRMVEYTLQRMQQWLNHKLDEDFLPTVRDPCEVRECQINKLKKNKMEIIPYANKRCGLWYCNLDVNERDDHKKEEKKTVKSVYFKSGDGHYHHWSFNLKRMNTNLLIDLMMIKEKEKKTTTMDDDNDDDNDDDGQKEHQYLIPAIIDSTAGLMKRFPDSLARTVPIWCLVLNEYFERIGDDCTNDNNKKDDSDENTIVMMRLDDYGTIAVSDGEEDNSEEKKNEEEKEEDQTTSRSVSLFHEYSALWMDERERDRIIEEKLDQFVQSICDNRGIVDFLNDARYTFNDIAVGRDSVSSYSLISIADYYRRYPLYPHFIDSVVLSNDETFNQVCMKIYQQCFDSNTTPLILFSASNASEFERRKREVNSEISRLFYGKLDSLLSLSEEINAASLAADTASSVADADRIHTHRKANKVCLLSKFHYIQGAGDDCEHWCRLRKNVHLNAELFHRYRRRILSALFSFHYSKQQQRWDSSHVKPLSLSDTIADIIILSDDDDSGNHDHCAEGASDPSSSSLSSLTVRFETVIQGSLDENLNFIRVLKVNHSEDSSYMAEMLMRLSKDYSADLCVFVSSDKEQLTAMRESLNVWDSNHGDEMDCDYLKRKPAWVCVFIDQSKKYKHSLYNAMEMDIQPMMDDLMMIISKQCKQQKGYLKAIVVGDIEHSSLNVLLCLSISMVYYLIYKHQSPYDLSLWVPSFDDSSSLSLLCSKFDIQKSDINGVISRFCVEFDNFQPPRLLTKQVIRLIM